MWWHINMHTLSIVFVLAVFLVVGTTSQSPQVVIEQGILAGKMMTDRHGGDIFAFQGIPYGKPPINELRFKAPQPADGWEGIRDATSDEARCIQHSVLPLGSEDCLYLHVYTPELPNEESYLRPVMVWIHGGAFNIGSGGTNTYGPEFLLTQDIVLVTINYRLGIFGGFSIADPDLGVPGNPGLKDQSLALKWVKGNIVRFGGDPNDITIFGESAGGSSVHLQMMSPMSAGLFNKVIAQSGVAVMDFVNGERNNGILLAERLGVQTDNLEEMLDTLQGMSWAAILQAAMSLTNEFRYFHNPQVEIESNNEPSFLPRSPSYLLETGQYNHCPLLLGVNDQEGLLFQLLHRLETSQNITVTNFFEFIPVDLQVDMNSDTAIGLAGRIKQFYFGNEEPTPTNIVPTINLYTDFAFVYAAYRSAIGHIATMTDPIYFYYFTADTRLNMLKHMDETTTNYPGAAHADELTYLFYNAFVPDFEAGSVEDLAIERMVKLWTNFAKFGNPTPSGGEDVVWEPLTEEQFRYLHIDSTEATMVNGIPTEERMKFWADIYKDYYPGPQ